MKKILKLAAVAMSMAMVLGLSFPAVKAQAAATTWYVTYDKDTRNYYFTDAPDTGNWAGAEALDSYFNDGDIIVINGDGLGYQISYRLTVSKTISELAFTNGAKVIVDAPRVNKTYSVVNSVGVVNAPFVDEVASYVGNPIQVNGNVGKLVVDYSGEGYPSYGVSGTVDEATLKTDLHYMSPVTIYSIQAGKCVCNDKGICTAKESQYSTTPGGSSAPAAAPAANPAAPATGKVLDSVPKTGATQLSECLVFFTLATVFAIGAFAARKKAE